MEPPKPKTERRYARKGLAETHAEFERLLSTRFESDPSVAESGAQKRERTARDRRLATLGEKIAAVPAQRKSPDSVRPREKRSGGPARARKNPAASILS